MDDVDLDAAKQMHEIVCAKKKELIMCEILLCVYEAYPMDRDTIEEFVVDVFEWQP